MKKFLFFLLCLPCVVKSQRSESFSESGIKWTTGLSWNEIKEKASRERKYIFLDCFTTWCGPCKKMDVETYVDTAVGRVMNEKFISVRVQFDRTSGDNDEIKKWYQVARLLSKQYQVNAYPSFLYFNPDGNLVHKETAFKAPKDFLTLASEALNPKTQYAGMLAAYRTQSLEPSLMPDLARRTWLTYNNKPLADSIARTLFTYLETAPEEEFYKADVLWTYRLFLPDTKGKAFPLFFSNSKKINAVFGEKFYARSVADSAISREIIFPIDLKTAKGKKPDYRKIFTMISERFGSNTAERIISMKELFWYLADNAKLQDKNSGYMDSLVHYTIRWIENGGNDISRRQDDSRLTIIAQLTANLGQNQKHVEAACKWMEGVVKRKQSYKDDQATQLLQPYVQLLARIGQIKKAKEVANEVISMATKERDTNTIVTGQWMLDRLNRKERTWPTNFSATWQLQNERQISGTRQADQQSFEQYLTLEQESDSIRIGSFKGQYLDIPSDNKISFRRTINKSGDNLSTSRIKIGMKDVDQTNTAVGGSRLNIFHQTFHQTSDQLVNSIDENWYMAIDGKSVRVNRKYFQNGILNSETEAIYSKK